MEHLTAQDARDLVNTQDGELLLTVSQSITDAAHRGKRSITLYDGLAAKTKAALKKLGYTIEDADGMAQQRDGVYHYISW